MSRRGQGSAPKQWTRTSVPKVRTGCFTCKKRHLKCDEEKPACKRCRKAGFECDGYRSAAPLKQGMIILPTVQYHRFGNYSGSPLEEMALHHAISYTVQHLGDLATRRDFWCINVPRTSHGVSAVRHALVALGAAHWSFLSRQSSVLHSSREQQCLGLFLNHYNLAIRHLGPSMANAAPQDMRTILMCCLIFICVENMRGRYEEALRHLKAGLSLLISLRPTSRVATLGHWGVCGTDTRQDVADNIPQDDELDSLALLFSRLALDISVLTDGDVVSHLEMLGQPESIQFPVSSGSPTPFPTAAAARDELHRFEIFHDIYYERVFQKNAPNTDGPLEFDQEDKDIYRTLYRQYQWWRVCFDLYVETRKNSATPEEQDLIAKLRLNQLTWNALFKHDHWSLDLDPILVPGELEAIVEQAETIACSTSTRNHPVFTFDADIIPSLSYVGAFSDDPDLLRRLVKVLRKLKVREGPWDSDELAEIYEGVLVAREQYGQVISGYPGGLLSVAEALAALGLPCVKPTNSILRLSSSVKGYSIGGTIDAV